MAEVDASTRRRAEYSSDASLYRVPPELVVFLALVAVGLVLLNLLGRRR